MTESSESATVFVVVGTQGEYSDRSVWPAAVFSDETAARRFVMDVQTRIRVAVTDHEEDTPEREAALKEIDPELIDWQADEATYTVKAVPFR